MNERAWLEETDPQGLFELTAGRISARKTRLFAVACCRLWGAVTSPLAEALGYGERFADEEVSLSTMREVVGQLRPDDCTTSECLEAVRVALYHPAYSELYLEPPNDMLVRYAPSAFGQPYSYALLASVWVAEACARKLTPPGGPFDENVLRRCYLEQANLLRGFVGNPFRDGGTTLQELAAAHPRIRLLAADIYARNAFERLPDVVGLYKDYGVDGTIIPAESIATHARQRGNWLVDTALGWQ